MVNLQALETWLWDAACAIRGPVDAPKFKDYILPLVFLKRLSDVFEDELERLGREFGSREVAVQIVEDERDRGTIAAGRGSVRFYIPEGARWENVRRQTTGLGQYLTDAVRAVARENGFQRHCRRAAHSARRVPGQIGGRPFTAPPGLERRGTGHSGSSL